MVTVIIIKRQLRFQGLQNRKYLDLNPGSAADLAVWPWASHLSWVSVSSPVKWGFNSASHIS